MIYLDNAATSYPKPPSVMSAVNNALRNYGANPGRSGYNMAVETAEKVYDCRKELSDFFGAGGAEFVAFTLNCTYAINMVIKGVLKRGDHVVVSSLEHNAVMRPLEALKSEGITYTKAGVWPEDNDLTVNSFREAINEHTKLIITTHSSNVLGIRMPIERIAALGHAYGIPILVDCAQSAGYLPINVEQDGIDFLCGPGHKGLYGPMGTGFLITRKGKDIRTIIEGGTGTSSFSLEQPELMPERFESGTVNVPGIYGLLAGVKWVKSIGIDKIQNHGITLLQKLYDDLSKNENIILYTKRPDVKTGTPVLSFNVKDFSSEETGSLLADKNVAVRAGLHCAPAAHLYNGTIDIGTVRVCPSYMTTMNDINMFTHILYNITKKH